MILGPDAVPQAVRFRILRNGMGDSRRAVVFSPALSPGTQHQDKSVFGGFLPRRVTA